MLFYHQVAFTGSAYMFGLMVGSFICGWCSDRFHITTINITILITTNITITIIMITINITIIVITMVGSFIGLFTYVYKCVF